jgi:hypothetical protein
VCLIKNEQKKKKKHGGLEISLQLFHARLMLLLPNGQGSDRNITEGLV